MKYEINQKNLILSEHKKQNTHTPNSNGCMSKKGKGHLEELTVARLALVQH